MSWGYGYLLGVVAACLLYFLVIRPGEKSHQRKLLKLKREKIEKREKEITPASQIEDR